MNIFTTNHKSEHTNKPLIIPVFIPHSGCPHQCAFCNQSIITNQKSKLPAKVQPDEVQADKVQPEKTQLDKVQPDNTPSDTLQIDSIIKQYLEYKGSRKSVELAFFGGNFLGLPHKTIIKLLETVKPYIIKNLIHGIRFSTRPDTINTQTMELIKPYKISAVELGVQSMNDEILIKSKRGHLRSDTINAINLLKKQSFKIGVQVMVGLPHDSEVSLLKSTKEIAQLSPDFARIYPLMVLKGSLIEQWYLKGLYKPLSLDKSVTLVTKMYQIFKSADIDVIRMGLQASEMMEDESKVLAGPWHPAFGHLVFSQIFYDMICNKIDRASNLFKSNRILLKVHPKSESRLRGDKNSNLKKLKLRYPNIDFLVDPDDSIQNKNDCTIQQVSA